MIIYTDRKNKVACRAFVGLVFSCLLIFGLFIAIPAKTAKASNNYIDDISFFVKDGDLHFKFHTKTTFSNTAGYHRLIGFFNAYSSSYHHTIYFSSKGGSPFTNLDYVNPHPDSCDCSGAYNSCSCVFLAGQTYDINLNYTWEEGNNYQWTLEHYIWSFGSPVNTHFLYINPFIADTEYYYFSEFPELSISFPHDNDEIAESFNIQGSYTMPAGSGYNLLMAGFFQTGTYDINWNSAVNVFSIPVSEPSGSFNDLRISNYLPKGIYDIYFRFYGGGAGYEFPFHISNINIVSDLPYELPITREVPPDIPIFSSLSAQTIYTTYSNYASSTPFFNAITGAIEPIVLTIGDNLTFFSSQFSQENARDIGEKTGNGILLVRAYAGNINSFFNDLPIAEVLFLYLMTLIVVSVFRIIRILLKLIPFT